MKTSAIPNVAKWLVLGQWLRLTMKAPPTVAAQHSGDDGVTWSAHPNFAKRTVRLEMKANAGGAKQKVEWFDFDGENFYHVEQPKHEVQAV